MIKVLVVDDSAFMRLAIRKILEQDRRIRIVGEARDGEVALRMLKETDPDVITMDVEMPIMDGLQATRRIMNDDPRPIIMLSQYTSEDSPSTIKAIRAGAVDFISKASSFTNLDISHIQKELLDKILYWSLRRKALPTAPVKSIPPSADEYPFPAMGFPCSGKPVDLVAVGVSTGGPRMLPELLRSMGRLPCPMVVAQHMPELFTRNFARQLHDEVGGNVVEGESGMALRPGMVVILPGGRDSKVRRNDQGELFLSVLPPPHPPTLHPSVNLLFESVTSAVNQAMGVILTGMGDDGTNGARLFVQKGWPVLVQAPETCVVGGMPGAALKAGVVTESASLARIGLSLLRCTEKH